MRAMLDAHGDIRCGEETHVIPDILELREQWNQSAAAEILKLAGVTEAVLRKAIGAFMIELITNLIANNFKVIINHGPKARRFCDKDPLSLLWMEYIHEIFPNSKFILLLRDGRATVHSIITRQIPVARFDTTRPEDCLREWNRLIELMFSQCERLGRSACFPFSTRSVSCSRNQTASRACLQACISLSVCVCAFKVHYERLVLDSRTEMRKILQFIDVEWSEDVLHHEKFVEKYVKLSPGEYSSSQVRMPIHREALSNWFDFYSFDVRSRMHQLAPMLAKLGIRYADPISAARLEVLKTLLGGIRPNFFSFKSVNLVTASFLDKRSNSYWRFPLPVYFTFYKNAAQGKMRSMAAVRLVSKAVQRSPLIFAVTARTSPIVRCAAVSSRHFSSSSRYLSAANSDLVEALKNEINAEKQLEAENLGGAKAPAIPGFTLTTNDAEDRFRILVVFNVNHSVDMDEDIEGDTQQVPVPVALPPFTIEITKGDERLCFHLDLVESADEEGQYDFRVEEFYVAPAAKGDDEDVAASVYASSGKYIDPFEPKENESAFKVHKSALLQNLHELLFIRYLEERGFNAKFCQDLVNYATHYEHSQYVGLLGKIKNFVSK
ncbi:unnamed protein product [Toxocara canis]|uniref:Protein-tyrosine sulfotransferase n=1 Tax=Toxocara canis TaxID=6265 RepID=A0A183V5L2_TOXCA|nr:unnamed protein product [Toxocara canis]